MKSTRILIVVVKREKREREGGREGKIIPQRERSKARVDANVMDVRTYVLREREKGFFLPFLLHQLTRKVIFA